MTSLLKKQKKDIDLLVEMKSILDISHPDQRERVLSETIYFARRMSELSGCLPEAKSLLKVLDTMTFQEAVEHVKSNPPSPASVVFIIELARTRIKTESAKFAAEARHNKENGSRAKQNAIRKIWASGKYSSRDLCAEEECAALNMSFSAARKALRNTPGTT